MEIKERKEKEKKALKKMAFNGVASGPHVEAETEARITFVRRKILLREQN